jgi:plastocyanin
MSVNRHDPIHNELQQRPGSGTLSRRDAVQILAALGVTAAGVSMTRGAAAQEATPAAAPAGPPQAGLQSDGTRLWRVQVAGSTMDEGIELMRYFPSEITINAGDAIFFDFSPGMPEIPHTVTFLAGQDLPELLIPDPAAGTPTAGATPAAGAPRIIFNPVAAFPAGSETVDGSGVVSSGLDILRLPDEFYTLTFPTPGTYDYVDLVFPMALTGQVVVQEQGAALPQEQEAYDQATAEEQAQMLERGRELIAQHSEAAATERDDGTSLWEVTTGVTDGPVEVSAFMPAELTITAGDTVRWTTEQTTLEVHTATFVGGEAAPELILIEPQEGGPPTLVINPELIPPAGGPTYDGTGFANTGFLGTRFRFPPAHELTFTTPGEYPYYCAVHGSPNSGMRGTIIVSAAE